MKGKFMLTAALAAVLLLGGCGGKQDTPAAGGSAAPAPAGTQASGEASGSYVISNQDSTASYSVQEKFLQQNLPNLAVGKTSAVKGELVLEKGAIKPSTVTVDVSSLKSDKAQRDRVLKERALESAKYPEATFTITGMEGAQAIGAGQETAFKLKGTLKVHGVEKAVLWDAKGLLVGNTLKLTATLTFAMSDFQIEPPNVLNVVSVDDKVQLDVSLVATKG